MAYEHREGQGSLFKNEKLNDRQPDYKGTILVGGTTYEIAAWSRTSQSGKEYLSLQASLPREGSQPGGGRQAAQGGYRQYQAPSEPVYQAPVPPVPDTEPLNPEEEDLPF